MPTVVSFAAAHLNWFYRLLNKLHTLSLSFSLWNTHTHPHSNNKWLELCSGSSGNQRSVEQQQQQNKCSTKKLIFTVRCLRSTPLEFLLNQCKSNNNNNRYNSNNNSCVWAVTRTTTTIRGGNSNNSTGRSRTGIHLKF